MYCKLFIVFSCVAPQKWETKVIASHVAEFEAPPQAAPPTHPQHPPPYPPHAMHAMSHYPPPHNPYAPPPPHPHPPHAAHPSHQAPPPPGPGQAHVKSEPVDSRYVLNGQPPYNLPSLPGPQIPGASRPPAPAGQQNVLSFSQSGAAVSRPTNQPTAAQAPAPPAARYPPAPAQNGLPPTARIPQVDGPSSSSSDSETPPPSQSYAPRSSHPSLPQPSQSSSPSKGDDSEAINSDLDDSDSDNDQEGVESGAADSDIVFCTYDKVSGSAALFMAYTTDGRNWRLVVVDFTNNALALSSRSSRLRVSRINGSVSSRME